MSDLLIKNEAGTRPVATANSNDPIGAQNLRVTNLDPANLIVVGNDYQVGFDDGTNMRGRTCTAKAGNTATFVL
ncbi:hypothetical protein [Flavobacterium ginsenosidimutans]|uniref:Uncharacterized protein n=1 Tax=Flavobacterium ginsenosidimutans TaxID=687844 RepID=A0ABZ2QBX6_9FLAO|nr:hypothetical protein [Flavobacterium ginsenosidimutans]KAF2334075.1 hypothetical protein DM444_06565 [Flavobacterium ginsenosidimutans]